MDTDASDAIARLEEAIERLVARREHCRKLSHAAKIAIAAGFALLAVTLTGLLAFRPSLLLGSLAASIGGIVLLGSNARTWDETEAALRQAEAQRTALIGALELRVVEDGVRWLQ
jgi:hypothetical protein